MHITMICYNIFTYTHTWHQRRYAYGSPFVMLRPIKVSCIILSFGSLIQTSRIVSTNIICCATVFATSEIRYWWVVTACNVLFGCDYLYMPKIDVSVQSLPLYSCTLCTFCRIFSEISVRWLPSWNNILGSVSIRKTVLPGMAIPMLKIRRPNGRLIFNMEIAICR